MYVCFFVIFSVLHPSRSVRGCILRKFAHSLVCFHSWLLAFYQVLLSCLNWTFFLSLPFLICIFFRLWFRFFDVELSFSSCLLLTGSMWSSRFLWRLVQRTACIWYVPARTSLFIFVWGVDVLQLSCVLLFACFVFIEVFLPLQGYWSLSCDHGLHCIVS